MLFRTAAALVAAYLILAAALVHAHEGHDHGEPPAASVAAAAPRAEAVSELFQLVAISRGGVLELWLDRAADNAPVSDASIEVETPEGSVTARPMGEGLYAIPSPWASATGQYDLIFTVTQDGVADILLASLSIAPPEVTTTLIRDGDRWLVRIAEASALLFAAGGFVLGALCMVLFRRRLRAQSVVIVLALMISGQSAAKEPILSPDLAQRLPDGSVFVPKPTQRILAIRTTEIVSAQHARTVALPGRIIPDPEASGVVTTAIAGRLIAPAGGFPRLGTLVKANDTLAQVEPSLQVIDASDVQQRAGELDQQIAIARRRVERLTALKDVVARSQTEEAVLELAGLLDRRRRLEVSRRSPEALTAPVSGVVAASNAVAGMIAQTNAVIFQIADPSRLWVEALTFISLPDIATASGRLPDGRSVALAWRGSGLAGVRQATPIHFAIQSDSKNLRVGELITVHVMTGVSREGFSVPRESLLRGANGQSIVWEHVSPERFLPRLVRFEAIDGERALILAGIEPGARVVIQGAELLNQIR